MLSVTCFCMKNLYWVTGFWEEIYDEVLAKGVVAVRSMYGSDKRSLNGLHGLEGSIRLSS